MINNDRIVPVQKIDLLTLYGTILRLADVDIDVLEAGTVDGAFQVTENGDAGSYLANQPVKTLDFGEEVTAGVYFVAAYDYAGITVEGEAATIGDGSATVKPDGVSLYYASLESGEIRIAAMSPELAE